jgi:hypothetical protein
MLSSAVLPRIVLLVSAFFVFLPSTLAQVSSGATWKYLDNGTNQGTAWRQLSFDDSAWQSGRAQLARTVRPIRSEAAPSREPPLAYGLDAGGTAAPGGRSRQRDAEIPSDIWRS